MKYFLIEISSLVQSTNNYSASKHLSLLIFFAQLKANLLDKPSGALRLCTNICDVVNIGVEKGNVRIHCVTS